MCVPPSMLVLPQEKLQEISKEENACNASQVAVCSSRKENKHMKIPYVRGHQHGYTEANAYENYDIEKVILDAMQDNPYQSDKNRKDYVDGVSEGVNLVGRIRTHKEVYGQDLPREEWF